MIDFPSPAEAREIKLPFWPSRRREFIEDMLGQIGVGASSYTRGTLVSAAVLHQINQEMGVEPPYCINIQGGGMPPLLKEHGHNYVNLIKE